MSTNLTKNASIKPLTFLSSLEVNSTCNGINKGNLAQWYIYRTAQDAVYLSKPECCHLQRHSCIIEIIFGIKLSIPVSNIPSKAADFWAEAVNKSVSSASQPLWLFLARSTVVAVDKSTGLNPVILPNAGSHLSLFHLSDCGMLGCTKRTMACHL